MTRKELDHAIQSAFDGTLTEAECLALREEMKSDPAARALYYQYAALEQSLVYRISRFTTVDAAKSLADVRQRVQSRRILRFTISAVAAVLVVTLITLQLILVDPPVLASYRVETGSLYTIENTEPGKKSSSEGLSEDSIVNLTRGSFEFTLRNGIRSVVLAPARLQLRNEMEMDLSYGTVWVEVSKDGKGFRVKTPEFLVTDLGTRFGVLSATDSPDEVHVLSGKVEVRVQSGAVESLGEGQARLILSDGKLQSIPVDPGHFLSELPKELLFNGDFESGVRPDDADYGEKATAALLPGWNFGRNVSVTLNTSNGTLGHGQGNSAIVSSTQDVQVGFRSDTKNDGAATPDGAIWQSFATVPGQRYEVSFEMGGIFGVVGDLRVTTKVYDGLSTSGRPLAQASDSRAGVGRADSGYNPPKKFVFTARSRSATLLLAETSANSKVSGPAIDNVAVRKLPE